jgi:PAS domain S-box-containing protein
MADLLTMHVLPLYMPKAEATGIMRQLHLDYRWPITIVGVGSVAFGLAAVSRGVSALVEELLKSERDLRAELALRKESEQALRESEERFSDFAKGASHWFWEMDSELRYTYLSPSYEQYSGVHPESVVGKTRAELYAKVLPNINADEIEHWKKFENYTKSRQSFHRFEQKWVRPNGEVRYFQTGGKPVFDKDGTFKGYRGIGSDVTDIKTQEEALRQAQKMEAMGQLTGGVAHDFNNLLAVIMGNAEVLVARLGDDNRPAQAVIRAATRGAELIERLLAFSRTQPLSPQSINIDAVITEMTYMLHRTLGETIEIEIRIAPDLWRALADPNQLGNAVLNLAINARDAMPNGGKLIIESANAPLDESYTASHSEVTPGDYVMLAVSDTGSGMSPEVLEHAFEPFFTTKEVGAGSGLGLSMIYGFAKQSDGEVSIHSEEGRGTTVRLYLPRAEEATDKADGEISTEGPKAGPHANGETILVVEDDPDVRALAEVVLENLRYRVLTAEDGRSGLAALEKAPGVDLLLSDVVLPGGMSGPDLAEHVRRRSPRVKVLFMSGYVDTAIQHHSPLPKKAELLKKPFRKNELAQKVRAVLDR